MTATPTRAPVPALAPLVRDAFGWASAFALPAPGPLLGVVAMIALARSPYAARIAGGRG